MGRKIKKAKRSQARKQPKPTRQASSSTSSASPEDQPSGSAPEEARVEESVSDQVVSLELTPKPDEQESHQDAPTTSTAPTAPDEEFQPMSRSRSSSFHSRVMLKEQEEDIALEERTDIPEEKKVELREMRTRTRSSPLTPEEAEQPLEAIMAKRRKSDPTTDIRAQAAKARAALRLKAKPTRTRELARPTRMVSAPISKTGDGPSEWVPEVIPEESGESSTSTPSSEDTSEGLKESSSSGDEKPGGSKETSHKETGGAKPRKRT